jgi:hypothetical protein
MKSVSWSFRLNSPCRRRIVKKLEMQLIDFTG